MRTRLRKTWETRTPLERAFIAALVVLLAIALYGWFVQAGTRARAQLHASVAALQAQAARLDQQALEYARLRAAPAAAISTTDLRTLVQSRIDAAGLARALVRIDAPTADQVLVVFGAVAFADWLNWIAALQSQQVRLESARIEALSTPGMVSVTASLSRAKAQ
ncbi:MAG: type II secretion system protein GspM [Betaproteobacteria bacterium]